MDELSFFFYIVGYKLQFNVFLKPSMEGFTSSMEDKGGDKVWVMIANPEDKAPSTSDAFEEEEHVETEEEDAETKALTNIVKIGTFGARLVLCWLKIV